MGVARESTCKGFNEFLDAQRKVEGEAFVALTQFDTEFEPNYGFTPIDKVDYLDYSTYQPRGSTALYDAIARSIAEVENSAEEFDQVLFVIITDGAENASQEYGRRNNGKQRIFELIKRYSENWQFVYIGASADAYSEGVSIGVHDTVRTGSGPQGMSAAFNVVSTSTADYRGSGLRTNSGRYFSDEEKETLASTVDKEG